MYRYRNKIVHQAAHDLNIAGLTANLLYYLREILNKVLYELATDDTLTDLHEVSTCLITGAHKVKNIVHLRYLCCKKDKV